MEEIFFNILTYLIVFIAVFLGSKKFIYKIFKKDESSCSSGCGGCTSTCELKNFTANNSVNSR